MERESIFIDSKEKLNKKIQELEKEKHELILELRESHQKYNDLKKRYNNLSNEFSLLLCEVRGDKNEDNIRKSEERITRY